MTGIQNLSSISMQYNTIRMYYQVIIQYIEYIPAEHKGIAEIVNMANETVNNRFTCDEHLTQVWFRRIIC